MTYRNSPGIALNHNTEPISECRSKTEGPISVLMKAYSPMTVVQCEQELAVLTI